jgi:hypothetical protein
MDTLATLLPPPTAAIANLDLARRERAERCRKILSRAKLGNPHTEPAPEALAAAKELLDLGFPYAFELTPDELRAVREDQSRGPLFLSYSLLAIPWVIICGTVNAVAASCASGSYPLAMVTMAASAFIAIAAGLNVFRLNHSDCDQPRAARRLLGWTVLAAITLAIDLAFFDEPFRGWINAGWIVPFTLPLAIAGRRHSNG